MCEKYNAITRALQCRIDPETQKEVVAYAVQEKISIAETLRRFVDREIQRRTNGRRSSQAV
jgi:hypothetical protein